MDPRLALLVVFPLPLPPGSGITSVSHTLIPSGLEYLGSVTPGPREKLLWSM